MEMAVAAAAGCEATLGPHLDARPNQPPTPAPRPCASPAHDTHPVGTSTLPSLDADARVAQLLLLLGCRLVSTCVCRRVQAGPPLGGLAACASAGGIPAAAAAAPTTAPATAPSSLSSSSAAAATAAAGPGATGGKPRISTAQHGGCNGSDGSGGSCSSRSGTGLEALVHGVLPVVQTWAWQACGGCGAAYRQCAGTCVNVCLACVRVCARVHSRCPPAGS